MRIGITGGLVRIPTIVDVAKEAGYDFLEENLFRLDLLTDEEFADLRRRYREMGAEVYSCNNFFPYDMSLYDDDALEKVRVYAERALAKANALGVKVCVVGSGKSRNIPPLWSVARAKERFVEVLKVIGDEAAKYGIRLAIEPLYRGDSNFIHTVAEAMELAVASGRENVGALVDFYHFTMNGEDEHGLECAKGRLFHVHMARATDRRMPKEEDRASVDMWLRMLRDIGYDGNMALEGKYGEDLLEDVRATAEVLTVFRSL